MPISNRPWSSVKESDYSVGQWHRACLIHLHPSGQPTKETCKLPVRTPSGALNRNGVHAAAVALAGGRSPLQAPPAAKRAAAKQLRALYGELKEDVPDSIRRMAS